MKPADLTLCLIVKNEEDYIDTCIQSVAPIVKEIRIADTGSTDRTPSLCKRYTPHFESIDFSRGFSHARNHLLDQVQTEWVLFLDADEFFDRHERDKLLQSLQNVSSDVAAFSCLRYNFFSNGAFYTSDTIKLFRSHPKIRYSGVVVDSVKPALRKLGKKTEALTLVLNHFGHCRSVSIRNKKARRYLQMMDEELKQNPTNFRVMGYRALILRTLGQLNAAKEWGQRALDSAPEESHPHFVQGHVLRAFGDHAQASDAYTRALELEPDNAVYRNSRGIAELTLGNDRSAEKEFKAGLEQHPHHVHFKVNLGLVEQARENFSAAAALFSEVAQSHPAFLETRFEGCTEIDPHSGYIFDTVFNFKGLAYHLAYCHAKSEGRL